MFGLKQVVIALLLCQASAAPEGDFDYRQHGADWPEQYPDCGLPTNQSPINLEDGGFEDVKRACKAESRADVNLWALDKLKYRNLVNREVTWNGKTSLVTLSPKIKEYYTSAFSSEFFMGPAKYYDKMFHVHHPSEHTVDGKSMDLEFHSVHAPRKAKGGLQFSAVGILFSVENFTAKLSPKEQKVIDNFFESLRWDITDRNPVVEEINYGDLMMLVDTGDKWVYKGSVTTPPCARFVYWNVIRTVYPIQQRHVDLFKKQMDRNTDYTEEPFSAVGNNRKTYPTTAANEIAWLNFVTDSEGKQSYDTPSEATTQLFDIKQEDEVARQDEALTQTFKLLALLGAISLVLFMCYRRNKSNKNIVKSIEKPLLSDLKEEAVYNE